MAMFQMTYFQKERKYIVHMYYNIFLCALNTRVTYFKTTELNTPG